MAQLSEIKIVTLHQLEAQLGKTRFPRFIAECERGFQDQVDHISAQVLNNPDIDTVFVSGPTSSGKTTFSTRFSENLTASGRKTFLVSLDDYYKTVPLHFDEQGRPDYESIETLELDLLFKHLQQLQKNEEVHIPTFDFKSRSRIYEPHKVIQPKPGDVVMVEGLHGLAEEVLTHIDRSRAIGIFIMPNARLLSDDRMLGRTDIRMLRRISRDVFHRGTIALATIDYWPMIRAAEDDFVPRYLQEADFYVNSALDYEFCVIVPKAHRVLKQSLDLYMKGELPPSSNVRPGLFYADLNQAVKEAKRLIRACELIPEVDSVIVPERSILQEFI